MLLSGTYTAYLVLSKSYCVGALLQPGQIPRMYFLVCELCVSSCCVWVPFGAGVAGCLFVGELAEC